MPHKQSKSSIRRNQRRSLVLHRCPAQPENAWRGNIYIWLDRCAFFGVGSKTKLQALHAIKLAVSIDEQKCFRVRKAGTKRWKYYQAALIPPDLFHEFDGMGNRIVLCYVIAESAEGQRIMEDYDKDEINSIPQSLLESALLPHLRQALLEGYPGSDKAGDLWDELVGTLAPSINVSLGFNKRVQDAIDYMWQQLKSEQGVDHRITVEEIANLVHLSYDRFRHLFREELEVTFRTYLASVLFLAAMWRDPTTHSIAEIALDVGFSDASHLYKAFIKLLGLSKSDLFEHCHLVRCF